MQPVLLTENQKYWARGESRWVWRRWWRKYLSLGEHHFSSSDVRSWRGVNNEPNAVAASTKVHLLLNYDCLTLTFFSSHVWKYTWRGLAESHTYIIRFLLGTLQEIKRNLHLLWNADTRNCGIASYANAQGPWLLMFKAKWLSLSPCPEISMAWVLLSSPTTSTKPTEPPSLSSPAKWPSMCGRCSARMFPFVESKKVFLGGTWVRKIWRDGLR